MHVDYRLLIASAYSGFVIWHGGLSGSVPLSIATPGHPFEAISGVIGTSLIQPFWVLPVLAIAGLQAKDVMGYCAMHLLVTGIIISIGLTFLYPAMFRCAQVRKGKRTSGLSSRTAGACTSTLHGQSTGD